MLFSCKYAALALPILAFTSASDPPCSSMMLPRYVKVFTSSKSSLSIVTGLVHAVLYRRLLLFPFCILRPTTAEATATLVVFSYDLQPNAYDKALHDQLKEEETTREDNWKGIKEALISMCQEVLGLKKHHHKEWISIKTLDRIKERKNKKTAINNSRTQAEKVQTQAEYIEENKQVKKSIRADKKKYVKELAMGVEKAARDRNMKQLFDTAKELAGKYSKPTTAEQMVEYFEEPLKRPAQMNPPDIEVAHTDLPIDVNPPTTEEIRMAIRQIRSGKAEGPDDIPAEALKSDIEVTTNMLYLLFRKIWEEKQVPMDWKEGHLVKIPKKGDLSKCEKYRGITLLSIPEKVFN
ncbi:unnamed protein product [Schistosoma curassoni]|uniref:Reverse transcriptase domain-containing protein n=1 Tax=Schistosoma curassoni TaxID=6186 RepID=A0A183KEB2_9TREM|nr:unnamed protein product [Schistosoma curassoni]